MLELSSNNALVVPIVARSAKSSAVRHIYSKFRVFVIRFYMMSNKRLFTTTRLALIPVFTKNLLSPRFIGVSVTPLLIAGCNSFNALLSFCGNHLSIGCLIRTGLRTESSSLKSRSRRIVRLTAPLAIFISTVLGHQSEFNKIKGYSQ